MAENEIPVTELSDDTCWGYLASVEVGRLAVVHDGLPEIYPINFCLDGQSVVFRSADGTKLHSLSVDHHVAFEADGWTEESGWSVLLKGEAELITDPAELARCEKMPLLPWVATAKNSWVRIEPGELSGRAFNFGPEPTDN